MKIAAALPLLVALTAVVHSASVPSVAQLGGLIIVVDNQLNPLSPPESLIASTEKKTYAEANALCKALNETLADLTIAGNLQLAQSKLPHGSVYWVAGGAANKQCSTFSNVGPRSDWRASCHGKHFALCSNSAMKTTAAEIGGSSHQILAETNKGPIIGFRDNLSWRFLGIPFAKPPLGKLRFAAPQAPDRWHEPIQTTKFSSECVQLGGGSEDCLYLNVYTPSISKGTSLPVMYWIYGGGYSSGTASTYIYDGSNIASRGDVVVVTVNYRLNIFGFAEDTGRYPRSELPGNLALRDQIAGLEWVRDNIHHFGGDPHGVTIFGESAGASSVRSIIQTPKARGLFHKAISESDPWDLQWKTPKDAGNFTETIFEAAGCSTLDCARSVNASVLLKAFNSSVATVVADHPSGEFNSVETDTPSIDGEYLFQDWHIAVKTGAINRVPFLASINHDEGGLFIAGSEPNPVPISPSNATTIWTYLVINSVPLGVARGDALVKANLYPVANSSDPDVIRNQLTALTTDFFWNCPVRLFLREMSSYNPHVYHARFDKALQETNSPKSYCFNRVCHAGEITTVFGDVSLLGLPMSAEDIKYTQRIIDTWTTFARTGNPNMKGELHWPAVTPKNENVYILDTTSQVLVDGFNNAKCDFFEKNKFFDFDLFN